LIFTVDVKHFLFAAAIGIFLVA